MTTRPQTQTRPQTTGPNLQPKPNHPLSKPNGDGAQSAEEKTIEYIPLGETVSIKLTVDMVRRFLCVPTKQGHLPDDAEVIKYMMVCRQRKLNPWVGDCYLLGYDTNNGPKFSIVVAVQALFKRAEISDQFDGIESGVVVRYENGEVEDREGDLVMDGEELIGGWARVYRKDRGRPFYQRLALKVYRKSTPQWQNDGPGMIVKCCESGALRQAFPSDIGGLYLEQELHESSQEPVKVEQAAPAPSAASQLKDRLSTKKVEQPKQVEQAAAETKQPEQQAEPEQAAEEPETQEPATEPAQQASAPESTPEQAQIRF